MLSPWGNRDSIGQRSLINTLSRLILNSCRWASGSRLRAAETPASASASTHSYFCLPGTWTCWIQTTWSLISQQLLMQNTGKTVFLEVICSAETIGSRRKALLFTGCGMKRKMMGEPSPRLASHLCHIWGKPWSLAFSPQANAGSEGKLPWWGLQSSLCLQMWDTSSCLQNPSLHLDPTCEDQAPAARRTTCEGGS